MRGNYNRKKHYLIDLCRIFLLTANTVINVLTSETFITQALSFIYLNSFSFFVILTWFGYNTYISI